MPADWTNETYADAASFLVSGGGDGGGGGAEAETAEVESADVPRALRAISEALSGCDGAEALARMPAAEAEEWIRARTENGTGRKYEAFLRAHSHRCLREVGERTS